MRTSVHDLHNARIIMRTSVWIHISLSFKPSDQFQPCNPCAPQNFIFGVRHKFYSFFCATNVRHKLYGRRAPNLCATSHHWVHHSQYSSVTESFLPRVQFFLNHLLKSKKILYLIWAEFFNPPTQPNLTRRRSSSVHLSSKKLRERNKKWQKKIARPLVLSPCQN